MAKARRFLVKARKMLEIDLADEAGRAAYLATFHSAQALIFQRVGRSPKTHAGVHSQFSKIAASEPSISVELRRFLSQAYDLKAVADYEIDPVAVPVERASWAIDMAARFVDCLEALLQI